jgi:phosphonate transport system substrate-binding protein
MVSLQALRRAPRRAALALLVASAASAAAPASAEAPPASPARVLRFGVIAEEQNQPDRMLRAYGALLAQLRERLAPAGVDVQPLVVARDLDDLAGRLTRREVDFVIETVFPTLALQGRGAKLSSDLVVVRRGQREYHSVFFTKKDGPIRTLADLRGRTLVLQALRSTSAFALPCAELERAHLAVVAVDVAGSSRAAVRYLLAGSEINQAVWVLHGRGDAGAFNETDWAALPERVRAQLRVFHETRPIIRGLLSFRSDLDPGLRAAAREALVGLSGDDAGRAALAAASAITRFEPVTPADRVEIDGWHAALRAVGAR